LKKILIANRGEIASASPRTCRRLGVRTRGVHSTSTPAPGHVQAADEAVFIGPSRSGPVLPRQGKDPSSRAPRGVRGHPSRLRISFGEPRLCGGVARAGHRLHPGRRPPPSPPWETRWLRRRWRSRLGAGGPGGPQSGRRSGTKPWRPPRDRLPAPLEPRRRRGAKACASSLPGMSWPAA